VLKPGGLFVFNVWDRIAENVFANDVTEALAELFPMTLRGSSHEPARLSRCGTDPKRAAGGRLLRGEYRRPEPSRAERVAATPSCFVRARPCATRSKP
jgi:hypothetical protein